MRYTGNDNYTEILYKAIVGDFGSKFKDLGYRNKLEEMIRDFKDSKCSTIKRRDLEDEIATTLWENDSYPEYKKHFENEGKLRCGSYENLRNQNKVNEAAEIYLEYVSKFPQSSEIDKCFIDGLYEIYSSFKSSQDYMTRLVYKRLENIKSFDIKNDDTTRLLILKQFLKELNFFKDSPYYSTNFKDYILSQKGVVTEENQFNYTALTDDVFSVLSVKSDLLLREKENLINYLRYYGGVLPCLYDLYVNLAKFFDDTVLNSFDESITTISDVFKIDLFKLSVDDIRKDCIQSDFDEIGSLLKVCKKEGKNNFSLLINKFPTEYKLATICSLYYDIELDDEIINLISNVLPDVYLKQDYCKGKKLVDLVYCDSLAKITHNEIEERFADKRMLSDLINNLEKKVYDFDYDLPIKKSDSKLSADVKSIFGMLFEEISNQKKITGKVKKEILSVVENTFLSLNRESMSFLDILKIIRGIIDDYKISGHKECIFKNLITDYIVKSVFHNVNKNLYVDRIYNRADARYSNVRKITKNKTYDGEVDSKALKLLRMIDDFAACRFDEQRTTRELIYIFAIAFEMTVYTGAENEVFDKNTDVQKNLFYDIYADNFVNRYKNNSYIKLDGYGVNYKNYAELCFIYAIHNRKKQSSSEVLKEAYNLIEECKKKGKTKEQLEKSKKILSTQLTIKYKEDFSKIYLNANRNVFLNYVINNYVCVSDTTKTKNSSENRTAQYLYKSLYKKVIELEKSILGDDIEREISIYLNDSINFYKEWEKLYMNKVHCVNCEYRSKYTDFKCCPGYLDNINGKCSSAFDDYLEKKDVYDEVVVRKNIKHNLCEKFKNEILQPLWNVKKIYENIADENFFALLEQFQNEFKASIMAVSSGHFLVDNVTRTKFIALYYYYLILSLRKFEIEDDYDHAYMSDDDYLDYDLFDNFNNFYKFVKDDSISLTINKNEYKGLNKCLEACGYQSINTKNIYDVFVLFLVFRFYFNKIHNIDNQDSF